MTLVSCIYKEDAEKQLSMPIKDNENKFLRAFYEAQKVVADFIQAYSANQRINNSDATRAFFEKNRKSDELKERFSSSEVQEEAYEKLQQRDKEKDIAELKEELEAYRKSLTANTRTLHLRRWTVAAASVIVLFLASLTAIYLFKQDSPSVELAHVTPIVPPQDTQATITQSNGQVIRLGEDRLVIDEKGEPVLDAHLSPTEASAADNQYTTITVPRGGKLYVTLPDHSGVWINSDSELYFQSSFNSKERRIRLRGEAFFDVTAEKSRPFIVELEKGEVLVYGTQFNISNYETSNLKAVLIEGSIGFTDASKTVKRLLPSQKLEYDNNTQQITVETVNTSLYTSWINDELLFDRERLEDILTTLGRKYDVEIVYENQQVKNLILSGKIKYGDDLNTLLRVYESIVDVKFSSNGKRITVSK